MNTDAVEASASESLTPMPWQGKIWSSLDDRLQGGAFPHALLLTGVVGVGKAALSRAFAARLLCESPMAGAQGSHQPCGRCKHCRLLLGEGHPDLRWIQPEGARVIRVDQIRSLIEFAGQSPQVARRKVVVIDTTDRLNISAANALLKTLEEPVADTFLLLLHRAGRPLLPTIRSRCQTVRVEKPSLEESREWLRQHCSEDESNVDAALAWAGGAPLEALAMLQDERLQQRGACLEALQKLLKRELSLPEAVRPFQKMAIDDALDLLLLWAHDLVRASVSRETVRDQDAAPMLAYLAGKHPELRLHDLYRETLDARQGQNVNLNPELALMTLLDQWQGLMRKGPVAREVEPLSGKTALNR